MQEKITIYDLVLKILSTMKEGDVFTDEEMFGKCMEYAKEHNYYILTTEELN